MHQSIQQMHHHLGARHTRGIDDGVAGRSAKIAHRGPRGDILAALAAGARRARNDHRRGAAALAAAAHPRVWVWARCAPRRAPLVASDASDSSRRCIKMHREPRCRAPRRTPCRPTRCRRTPADSFRRTQIPSQPRRLACRSAQRSPGSSHRRCCCTGSPSAHAPAASRRATCTRCISLVASRVSRCI